MPRPWTPRNGLSANRQPYNVLARKESDRGTLSHVALPRILQSNRLGSQERRRLATGVRLKVSESLRMQGEIQDDQSPSSDKRITSWGLGRKCQFKRRLLPHPHTLQVQMPANDGLRVFQFTALLFGLTSVPRVFMKVILPIGHLAHTHMRSVFCSI